MSSKRSLSESLVLGPLLQKLARNIGANVLLEPEWHIAGQITFRSGKKSYFRYNTLDLNPVGASDIAKDKDYANFFMAKMGYPTITGRTFFRDDWCRAIGSKRDIDAGYRFAKKLGFPVVVKPNSGSQGTAVMVAHTKTEYYRAMRAVFKNERVALVQRKVSGRDYRIVVLDTEVISAYERIPLSVVGDGRSTIKQLLQKRSRAFRTAGRDTQLQFDDPRIRAKLKRQKLSFASVPFRGDKIFLLDNANLSTGGDAIDVTHAIHPRFKKLAVALTRDMGLRLCGVDLMIEGDISEPSTTYNILEINAAPGLDHYVKGGVSQKKIVERLYVAVLKALQARA